jgi:hypothetical protein
MSLFKVLKKIDECVTVMFWWQLFVGTNYQKNNFTILRSVVLPSNTNKNILFKARKFLWKLAFLNRSNERGPFEWVRYDTFPSFWNRHSSTEWDENFSEARTFIYLAAVEISALCHHNLLSYDNLKVKNGWVRYLWTCSEAVNENQNFLMRSALLTTRKLFKGP